MTNYLPDLSSSSCVSVKISRADEPGQASYRKPRFTNAAQALKTHVRADDCSRGEKPIYGDESGKAISGSKFLKGSDVGVALEDSFVYPKRTVKVSGLFPEFRG